MTMLEKAREIAGKAHAGQTRKGGEPYINHAVRVSEAAAKYSEDAAIVGMLHDVVEDAEDARSAIFAISEAGFSNDVLAAIGNITKKCAESYLFYILNIRCVGGLSKTVKLCDLADNLNGATGTLKDKYEMAQWILEH